MPVCVTDIEYDEQDNILAIATFGRGAWTLGNARTEALRAAPPYPSSPLRRLPVRIPGRSAFCSISRVSEAAELVSTPVGEPAPFEGAGSERCREN